MDPHQTDASPVLLALCPRLACTPRYMVTVARRAAVSHREGAAGCTAGGPVIPTQSNGWRGRGGEWEVGVDRWWMDGGWVLDKWKYHEYRVVDRSMIDGWVEDR